MANVKDKRAQLLEEAKMLPAHPGCYLMKDNQGKIIYIGKAKSLKNRVTSYFRNSKQSPKTEILIGHICCFDFMLSETEAGALVLENNLIKKHLPRYNVMLKDDKSYPYVVVNYDHAFPRMIYTRRLLSGKKKKVFGPFVTGSNIGEILRILVNSFSLRDCSDREFKVRKTPCLRFQMGQCTAPCVGKITKEDYEKDLFLATNLLEGKGRKILAHLRSKMDRYAELEEYEKAILTRDNLQKLQDFLTISEQKCAELSGREKSLDVVGYFDGAHEIDIAIYMVRGGILLGHKHFYFQKDDDDFTTELFRYYQELTEERPSKIVLGLKKDKVLLMREAFQLEMQQYKIISSGHKFSELLELTTRYAKERQEYRHQNIKDGREAHLQLKKLLQLSHSPHRIEAVDIAVFQGKSPTASAVSFEGGTPQKTGYRHYHLTELPEGNNDFAMMRELFERRLLHGNLPDLFLIDGGLGQLKIVQAVLDELEVKVPIVGIVKSRTRSDFKKKTVKHSSERLIIPGRNNPYELTKFPSLLKLMVSMRDEAHRFCRRLHHKQEEKRLFTSWIDQVPGVGEKIKIKILKQIDQPLEELATYNVINLAEYLSISQKLSQKILNVLQKLV